MSAPILDIEFTAEAQRVIAGFGEAQYKVPIAIARGMDRALPIVASNIQAQRLTGLGPFPVEEHMLGQVSGQLRQSVRWTEAKIHGEVVTSSIGSPVRYAAVHEFGFDGDVQVKPFFRKYRGRDQFARAERVSQKTGRPYRTKIKTASGVSQVKGHARHMKIPARAPFGFGIADSEQVIADAVSTEVLRSFKDL
jgi:phage gpG-like protein